MDGKSPNRQIMKERHAKNDSWDWCFRLAQTCRTLCVGALTLRVAIAGCGGGFSGNHATAIVSPASATVQVNGQVRLTAAEHDCWGCGPIDSWDVTENGGANCTWVGTPPDGPCPAGRTQAQRAATGLSGPTGTHFAPAPAAAFHAVVSDVVKLSLTAEATSVITASGSTT
jgi:hypothetical protein